MSSETTADEISKKLEFLGNELSKIQYNFKIKNKPSEKYWEKRIQEFDKYHTKTMQYFTYAYSLMSINNEQESGEFLLRISKLKQLGKKVLEDLEKVKKNPTSMDVKDKQQSKWTIEIREELIKSNIECLNHEKRMNVFFKDFYEKYLESKKN